MQVFRLVQPGIVDKVIAFDELPKDLVKGVTQRPPDGLPRQWREFAPSFYILDYISTNNDKESWKKIVAYVRTHVSPSFRLMDSLEDMAMPLAPNAKDALTLEPEECPVIPIAEETKPEEIEPKRTGKRSAALGA